MYCEFGKGDKRRLLFVLAGLNRIESATVKELVDEVGPPRSSVVDTLKLLVAGQMPGVVVAEKGGIYTIDGWGDITSQKGVAAWYKKYTASKLYKECKASK